MSFSFAAFSFAMRSFSSVSFAAFSFFTRSFSSFSMRSSSFFFFASSSFLAAAFLSGEDVAEAASVLPEAAICSLSAASAVLDFLFDALAASAAAGASFFDA